MSLYSSTIWDGNNESVAIVVPVRDTVYAHFSYCLSNLIKDSTKLGVDTHLFYDASTILVNQRERLVEQALDVNATWTLWLDSDMMFPSTTLTRLLSHKEEIVGCNYMKRSYPFKSVAYKDTADWDSWVPIQYSDTLEEVEAVGMGCILIKTELFKQLKKPYFAFTYKEETQDWLGEDFTLFKKLNKLGHKVKIDMNLSNEIYHMGTFAYGRSMSVNTAKKKTFNKK